MYRELNKFSEYIYFYISENISSYVFLLVFEIVKILQCIFKYAPNIFLNTITKQTDTLNMTLPLVPLPSVSVVPSCSVAAIIT